MDQRIRNPIAPLTPVLWGEGMESLGATRLSSFVEQGFPPIQKGPLFEGECLTGNTVE